MKILTALNRPVDCDLEKRILRAAVFGTTGLASDGAIILPAGMQVSRFAGNSVILDDHQDTPVSVGGRPLPAVIAAALDLAATELELTATVQFADTQRGRDFAWLYGCNPERAAYMRAWSVEAAIGERQTVDWETARKLSAQYWDETLAARMRKRIKSVLVATTSELKAVAAVPYGADRGALTRAAKDGNVSAWSLVARIDLDEASEKTALIESQVTELNERIVRLEKDIQALRGEGASAAARGDSEAILAEVRDMLKTVTAADKPPRR